MFLLTLSGCSSSPDDIASENSFAPINPTGKEFRFYTHPPRWAFKVLPGNTPSEANVSVNSETAILDGEQHCYYKQTSRTTASLNVNFPVVVFTSGPVYFYCEYDLQLSFTSAHQGTFKGVYKSTPTGVAASTETVSGYFMFDSTEEPNITEHIDSKYLAGSWKIVNGEYTKIVNINADKNYSISMNGTYVESGTYQYTDSDPSITFSYDGRKYKITKLTQNELEWLVPLPVGGFNTECYTRTSDEPQNPGGNFEISRPEFSKITNTSFTVKGTILGENNVEFEERGVCYSTTPGATISENKSVYNLPIISVDLTNLFRGTKYYVRLYAKVNGKISYGEEVSVITTGTQVFSIELSVKEISYNEIILKATLPNNLSNFGICYGKTPHPLVTDNSLSEATRKTEWTLPGLSTGTTYYIRAYHQNGTKIEYFDGEISIKTIGNMDFNLSTAITGKTIYEYYSTGIWFTRWRYNYQLTYNIAVQGTYTIEAVCEEPDAWGEYSDGSYRWRTDGGYISGGKGSKNILVENIRLGAKSRLRFVITDLDTGIIYNSKWDYIETPWS